MIFKSSSRDSLAFGGSILGIASVMFGWLTLKPNRVATGESYLVWEAGGWVIGAGILGLWLVCLVLSLYGRKKWPAVFMGITANLLVIGNFMLVGYWAGQLLLRVEPIARVSLGAGVWISLLAAYIIIFSARRRILGSTALRCLISIAGLAAIIMLVISGWFDSLSILQEYTGREARFYQELVQHILLFGASVSVGALIGIPMGIWATHSRRVEKPVFFVANITQTIPSLALLGLLIAPLSALSFAFPVLREIGIRGVGVTPAIIALVIYSLLPIIRNTFVGLRQLDPAVINAGLGMGMSRRQTFFRIEVPLAMPIVLEGVRIASVQAVGLVTVAALIGAGGLGWFVFRGLGQAAPDLIILGTIPIVALAFVVDGLMRALIKVVTPKGMAGSAV
ncbi:ABC transporter permease [Chloroflexota bacterium]